MAPGADLSRQQVARAISYDRTRFETAFLQRIQTRMGVPVTGVADEPFVRATADWQEAHLGPGQGSGMVTAQTEANLHLLLPEAERAVQAAQQMLRQGGYLYDGWSNDCRDNDCNGSLDFPRFSPLGGSYVRESGDPNEQHVGDGTHYQGIYTQFRVVRGLYLRGWRGRENWVEVLADRVIHGTFRYRNCADIISAAYHTAGVMAHHRHTQHILAEFKRKGFVWQRSVNYPERYLPGDFICTFGPDKESHQLEGHSAIVVTEGPTGGGRFAPLIIDLPGPSSQASDGIYDPASTNDLQQRRWPPRRLKAAMQYQYLCRLLHSRLRGHS